MTTHIEPKRSYYAVFAALMVLTGLTVLVANHDFGVFNTVAALGIACVKALLVVLIFMHVRHSPALTKVTVAAGFLWLVILLVLLLSDYISRDWLPGPQGW
jgi:cytochrome c oxidase subunit IV